MNKGNGTEFLIESWKKALADKCFDDLVEIIAHKERFNPDFVEMTQIKLREHKDYNEERVNTLIEKISREPLPVQKDPANTILKVANVGCLTMKVLFVIAAIPITIILINSDSTADNKAGALFIYIGLWSIYGLTKRLWKKKHVSPG